MTALCVVIYSYCVFVGRHIALKTTLHASVSSDPRTAILDRPIGYKYLPCDPKPFYAYPRMGTDLLTVYAGNEGSRVMHFPHWINRRVRH